MIEHERGGVGGFPPADVSFGLSPPRAGFSFAGVAQLKAEVFKGKFAGWF
jgi:hypothetical protein